MRGAGGTDGGGGRSLLGLGMLIGGGYLFFNAIRVHTNFNWGSSLYAPGGFNVTSGMVLIPFVIGVGLIFYSARNAIGWVLSGGSLVALSFGVIASIQFRMQQMSAFDLILILVLFIGGLGLFLSGLRDHSDEAKEARLEAKQSRLGAAEANAARRERLREQARRR